MNEEKLERGLRDAIAAETEPVRVDEYASLTSIRQRATAARRRRLVGATALGAAAALLIGIGIGAAVGGDDDDHSNVAANGPTTTIGADCASTTTGPPASKPSRTIVEGGTTSVVTDPPTTFGSPGPDDNGVVSNSDGCQDTVPITTGPATTPPTVSVPTTTAPAVEEAYAWPQADDTRSEAERKDPVATARTFLTDAIGISDPALGPFVSTDTDRGTIALFNGHGTPQPGAVQRRPVILARRASGDWVIIGARSDAIEITGINTGRNASSVSVTVSGKGRGFEAVLHVRVEGGGDAVSGTTMASGGMELAPFESTVVLHTSPSSIGVIVTNDSGEEGGAVDIAARAIQLP